MIKLKGIIFTDENGKNIFIEVPDRFQIPIPCSSDAHAVGAFASGLLLSKGYSGITEFFPDKSNMEE